MIFGAFKKSECFYKSMARCFSIVSVVILTALAASMVVFPLLLPTLPPPPSMLLFFPVGIMAALMFLAFYPSDAAAYVAPDTV
ncbi:hypothetical protein OIU78_013211 [Salix suchowensis]|nr:hypothetical protein OIU78_013211 [Salix suchowensis]